MSEEKKKQILAAAKECFVRFGYKKTTLDDIGRKIGLNKASIYYYFKNKEEIFTTIVLSEFEQFTSKLRQDISEDMSCDQKVLIYFRDRHGFWSHNSMIQALIGYIDPEKAQLFREAGIELYMKIEREEKSFIASILQNCIKIGQIKECNVEQISDFLFALVDGIKEKHMRFSDTVLLTPSGNEVMIKEAETALSIFLNGLK
ncbi:MAG: TetR/AcrR family transcriptional regulator [Candidatus Odinarchaeota archaeon]